MQKREIKQITWCKHALGSPGRACCFGDFDARERLRWAREQHQISLFLGEGGHDDDDHHSTCTEVRLQHTSLLNREDAAESEYEHGAGRR